MIKKLIRCTACNRVIPNYEGYDLTRATDLPGVEWSNADLASAKEFLRTHFGHTLEELLVEEDSCVSEKSPHEPLRVSYFLAGNAGRKFLIQRTKSALDHPASYEIVAGRLKTFNVSLKIQEKDLRKEIAFEKGFSPLLKERMEKFIQVFRGEIAGISPEKVEEEAEEIYESEGCTLAYAALNNSRWARILNRCRLYFDESELKLLNRFVDENRNPPDVLSIQIERRISIISLADEESGLGSQQSKETETEMEPSSIAVSKRGVREKP